VVNSVYAIAALLMTVILLVANYYLFESPSNLSEWSKRIEAKCGAEKLKPAYQDKYLVDLGQIGMGFMTYLGFLFAASRDSKLATKAG